MTVVPFASQSTAYVSAVPAGGVTKTRADPALLHPRNARNSSAAR
ncbi:hypothetical protein [Curtobacterium sp. Leaf261]|nr:hypothetical protein [Curtobacterium sp. Leaf261]